MIVLCVFVFYMFVLVCVIPTSVLLLLFCRLVFCCRYYCYEIVKKKKGSSMDIYI